MKDKSLLCGFTSIIIIGVIILMGMSFWNYPRGPFDPPIDYMKLSQKKENDTYILTIEAIVPKKIEPSKYEWQIVDKDNIVKAKSNFPIKSGSNESSTNNSITITWFDMDKNKKLSVNDTIQIEGLIENIERPRFRLIYEYRIVENIEIKI